jgi:hypothetical protein
MLCLLLVGGIKKRERKNKRNGWGPFFPRAGHDLLAVPCGIFAAVRCSERLI